MDGNEEVDLASTVVMPQMGYDMKEGTVVRWLKKEGEHIARGEPLAEIETDKAVVTMEAFAEGVLRRIVAGEGTRTPVGEVIAIIGTPDEPLPDVKQAPAATSVSAVTAPQAARVPEPAQAAAVPVRTPVAPAVAAAKPSEMAQAQPSVSAPADEGLPGGVRATPIARRIAREAGVDIKQVQGTGPSGRITEADVNGFIAQRRAAPVAPPPQPAPVAAAPRPGAVAPAAGREDLSRMRMAIANVTTQSTQTTPHFYITMEIDMTETMSFRERLNERLKEDGVRVSVNDLLIMAVTRALRKHPHFNASFRGDHLEIHPEVNIGIAVALPQGLIVPALRGVDRMSLSEIARAAKDLVARTQENRLSQEEYTSGTFSISNLGMFDVDEFTAIIFPPQAGVLAVGAVKWRPVVREGQIVARQTMRATVSVDHRVADGAEAARFLGEVKRLLEDVPLMLA